MGFGLPANRLPPPPPSAFLQRLLKVSATSIAVETTSTAYCLNPCQLSFQPPPPAMLALQEDPFVPVGWGGSGTSVDCP